jgi:tetratricopeptide (TPR) repeat protein
MPDSKDKPSLPPPPPLPKADTSELQERVKAKEKELARLYSDLEKKEAAIAELTEKLGASADEAEKLTQENLQLLEQMAALKRQNDELVKQAEDARDEISIVSQSRADGTKPETLPPHPSVPEGEAQHSPWPSTGPIREVPPPQDVIVGTPVSAPTATPVSAPEPEDVPEDSLPEVEPLPAELLVPRPKKSGFLWKFFLFLILAGGAFFAAWHFYPELFDFLKSEPEKTAVTPEDTRPEPAPAPSLDIPEELAEAAPEETPEEIPTTEPEEPQEEPVEKVSPTGTPEGAPKTSTADAAAKTAAKKKSRAEKRRPKKTARVIEDKMSVSEAKRQIRRMLAANELNEAQKMLADWVKKKPRDAGLHYLYGRLYLMLGKKNQAVDQFEEAIDIAPKMYSAYHDLGATYLQLGDNASACEALGHFLRLRPDHPRAPAIRELMKKIKCK